MINVIVVSGFVGFFLIDKLKKFEVYHLDKNVSPFFRIIPNLTKPLCKQNQSHYNYEL